MKRLFFYVLCLFLLVQASGLTFSHAMGKKPPRFDSRLPAQVQAQVLADLDFMYGLPPQQGARPMHSEVFGEISGGAYQNFFSSHIRTIGYSDCGANNVVACAAGFFWFFKRMWLTDDYINGAYTQAYRISVLFHEARHTETMHWNWPHANCTPNNVDSHGLTYGSTYYAGQPACDAVSRGSYGLEVILMSTLARVCAGCTEKFKMDASIVTDQLFSRIIDLDAREELYREMSGVYDYLPAHGSYLSPL